MEKKIRRAILCLERLLLMNQMLKISKMLKQVANVKNPKVRSLMQGKLVKSPPPPTKKKEYNRYKHIQEVIEVPNSKAKAKSRGRPTEYAITENKLMPVDRDQDSKEIVKRDE